MLKLRVIARPKELFSIPKTETSFSPVEGKFIKEHFSRFAALFIFGPVYSFVNLYFFNFLGGGGKG